MSEPILRPKRRFTSFHVEELELNTCRILSIKPIWFYAKDVQECSSWNGTHFSSDQIWLWLLNFSFCSWPWESYLVETLRQLWGRRILCGRSWTYGNGWWPPSESGCRRARTPVSLWPDPLPWSRHILWCSGFPMGCSTVPGLGGTGPSMTPLTGLPGTVTRGHGWRGTVVYPYLKHM